METKRIPGIECPHCRNFIPISIKQMLELSYIFCPTCGFRMDIDEKKKKEVVK